MNTEPAAAPGDTPPIEENFAALFAESLEVSDSLILAMQESFFPLTKAIYWLNGRPGDGPAMACALGLFGMLLLGASLWGASHLVGRKMGEMFRA